MSEAWSTYCDRYGLTPMEAKIFAVLAEGGRHSPLTLMRRATGKIHVGAYTASVHVYRMRARLQPFGVVIAGGGRGRGSHGGYELVMPAPEHA